MLAAHDLGSRGESVEPSAAEIDDVESGTNTSALEDALDRALSDLEHSIEAVRTAARDLLVERGKPPVSLGLLRLLEATVRQVREGGESAGIEPKRQDADLTGPARKTRLAQDALWEVRKGLRRAPAVAVERLAGLDLEDVDPQVVQQVYGEWLRQCARLGLEEPYKYDAAFGRGAVLVRVTGSRRLRVVSSIGLPQWSPGIAVDERELRGLRPLR
jgi:hypothetical protein